MLYSKRKNVAIVILVCLFCTGAFSVIGYAKNVKDEVDIQSIRCECCGGIVVLQESLVLNRTFEEDTTPTKTGSSYTFCCIFCQVDRTFKEYCYYHRVYEAIHYYHECLDCGWYSAGWTEPGDLIEETRCTYDMCSVCGWKMW